jgi:hypothetical protein
MEQTEVRKRQMIPQSLMTKEDYILCEGYRGID